MAGGCRGPLAVGVWRLLGPGRLLGLWLLLCAAVSVQAQTRVALVIGNAAYQHESVLANPVNDARLMARTLQGLGFRVETLTNLARRDMDLAIARFVRQAAGADTALLYYAGHGAQPVNGGRNFLLPVDARIDGDDALETDGIAADTIVERLERSANPARVRLVVLDACRNNRQAGRARSGVRGLARMTPSDDATLIAFSTNDQEVALDGDGPNSPYAQALARHLARAAELPLRRVFELTASDVRAATRQAQRPRTYGDLDSRMGLDGRLVAEAAAAGGSAGVPAAAAAPAAPAAPTEPGDALVAALLLDYAGRPQLAAGLAATAPLDGQWLRRAWGAAVGLLPPSQGHAAGLLQLAEQRGQQRCRAGDPARVWWISAQVMEAGGRPMLLAQDGDPVPLATLLAPLGAGSCLHLLVLDVGNVPLAAPLLPPQVALLWPGPPGAAGYADARGSFLPQWVAALAAERRTAWSASALARGLATQAGRTSVGGKPAPVPQLVAGAGWADVLLPPFAAP